MHSGPVISSSSPLAVLLRAAGLSAAQAGRAAGLPEDTMRCRVRRGSARWRVSELRGLAELLDLPIEALAADLGVGLRPPAPERTVSPEIVDVPRQAPRTDWRRRRGETYHGRFTRLQTSARVSPHVDTPCHVWQGGVNRKNGYGYLTVRGETVAAHRYAWEVACGPVPDDLHVLHRCDVKRCCNSDHLYLGTSADNYGDSIRHGHQPGKQPGRETLLAAAIADAGLTRAEVAESCGVHRATVAAWISPGRSHRTPPARYHAPLASVLGVAVDDVRRLIQNGSP